MGIFTRFKDIINANMNAMLDNAEDPEKLIKLMIREIEDTLVELKVSCAGAIASKKKVQREMDQAQNRMQMWAERAELAVAKGRDDLAREALMEKRRFSNILESLENEVKEHSALVAQYQDDIRQLEEKLQTSREKQRMLVQRHIHARRKKRAQEDIRRIDNAETLARFDDIENRIEQMEAEADLVNFGVKPDIEEKFEALMIDDEIERELNALKSSKKQTEMQKESL
ncbi:regulatory protein for phage-shock-protein operon [Desulfamplus magnetovallimortis]|uniref:Regulatory protein for phage-shock-protein operon n=1 Tax=Desulfamplus magnetovallimortis TaxID=1246637 RepID=A0A1W1H7Q7_9BACT|nr:PspA/IM30 family protein [Desulfamplus magnetovallimortis]SLM28408.1 regulatory protein for phage-shock-protein operon [Desulfamplus magnetovallimortis]